MAKRSHLYILQQVNLTVNCPSVPVVNWRHCRYRHFATCLERDRCRLHRETFLKTCLVFLGQDVKAAFSLAGAGATKCYDKKLRDRCFTSQCLRTLATIPLLTTPFATLLAITKYICTKTWLLYSPINLPLNCSLKIQPEDCVLECQAQMQPRAIHRTLKAMINGG